ncbi:hypothetical protein [uncultured Desulfosarcina sp.]|uniref:hypothetical protein n=1 Tax=uncultured Desulfosarcina sp. TaxID=218289 RepID=UPI0029C690BF|nr:hypothetical protein [uncultured Desulfosarcina sp.]
MNHRLEIRRIGIRLTIFSLFFMLSAVAYGGQLAVIELKHRQADDLIPAISPFLAPGDTLSGMDYFIFLNTTPENLARIRSIIAHLDQATPQLAITVVQGENAIDQLRSVDISGSVSIGDNVTVGVGDHRGMPDDSINVDAQSRHSTNRGSDIQRILVQDGATATVYMGLSVPVAMDSPTFQGMRYHQIQAYREMLTGVHVTPRISGNRVTLEIETQRDQPSGDNPGVFHTQQIRTQVQGRLNEWIEIGSLLGGSNRQATGHINSSSRQKFRGNHVFVKIAEIHP